MLRGALHLGAWLTSDLNLDLSRVGMPRQAFGGAMITSVGMWGISHAYSPLAHYYRVPLLVLVGAVRNMPVVAGDEVVIRPMLTLTATFDHRYVDGFHAARFAEAVRAYCQSPARFEPALPGACQPARRGPARRGPARRGPARRGPAQHGPARRGPPARARPGGPGRG